VGYKPVMESIFKIVYLMTGDCTGPGSAEFVLRDPNKPCCIRMRSWWFTAIRSAFKHCNVIVTNVSADHLGIERNTYRGTARSRKGVIPETVMPNASIGFKCG
jgi:cyanophycin synthetase